MQQLIQGWLAVTWGHSPWFLIAFAAARVLPKVALTLPAGLLCDRVPRSRILIACRWLNVLASILPLVGFILAPALFWLMIAIALGGAIHAFDLPAGRALVGDVATANDLPAVVALNNGGSHVAALVGPPAAFLLGPFGLVAAAALFAVGALLTMAIPAPARHTEVGTEKPSLGQLFAYVLSAPTMLVLLCVTIAPGIVDKLVLLLLPSVSGQGASTSLALLAPEGGAILAASILATVPVRLSVPAILSLAGGYAVLLTLAFRFSYEPELLVAGLALAGVTKLAFNTTSQIRIQETVPGRLRGRVLSF
jgi:predicted MFS family arabinose efflux permease